MGRRIFSSLLALALIFSLPVFSLADGGEFILKDSGSPEVSLMALCSIAADDGISLAAAEGNSGQFGYNIEPYSVDFVPTLGAVTSSLFNYGVVLSVPAGSYSFDIGFNADFYRVRVMKMSDQSMLATYVSDTSEISGNFSVSETTELFIHGTFYLSDISTENISVSDFGLSRLNPVEGISSGYTYNSGILDRARRSIFDTFDPSFGNLPAGKYLINIYHWGDSYDVRFQISDSTESYYLPTSTNGSVTTLVYNHPGGDFTLSGSFTADNIETTAADGYYATSGNSTVGDVDWHGPSSWVFNITDIVAIPYEQAGDSNFGFFAPIIGFFNDHFSSLKSFLTDKFNKDEDAYTGATSPELSQDINSASSMIDQEQQFMESINTQITDQSSNVDPVTVLDGIDGSSSVFSSMLWVSSIVSSGIDGMGVFQFLIYVPMILGVVTLVIGRGTSLAGRRPRSQASAIIRVYDRRK